MKVRKGIRNALDLVEGDRLHNTISNANTESRIKVTKVAGVNRPLTPFPFSDESEKGDQKRAGVNRPLCSRPLVSLPPPNVGCEGDFGRAGFIDRRISLWGTLDLVEGDRLHNTISNANTESRIKVTKVVLCEVSLTNSSK